MILQGWDLPLRHQLNSSLPADPNADEALLSKAKIIADALQKAKHPVIISGISCYNEAIIRAAFTIAAALNTTEKKSGTLLCIA